MNKALLMGGLLLPALLAAPQPAEASQWVTGRCVEVIDAAHVVVLVDGRRERVRLAGVDIHPIEGTFEALRARTYLASFIYDRPVRLEIDNWSVEPSGYLPACVYLDDANSTFVNVELVDYGYAFVGDMGPFYGERDRFWAAERRAHEHRLVVWTNNDRWRHYAEYKPQRPREVREIIRPAVVIRVDNHPRTVEHVLEVKQARPHQTIRVQRAVRVQRVVRVQRAPQAHNQHAQPNNRKGRPVASPDPRRGGNHRGDNEHQHR